MTRSGFRTSFLVLDGAPLPASFKRRNPGFCQGFRDPAGIRTQDPYIKSVLLYQLSYRIKNATHRGVLRFEGAKVNIRPT